jgi:hypothetical protein
MNAPPDLVRSTASETIRPTRYHPHPTPTAPGSHPGWGSPLTSQPPLGPADYPSCAGSHPTGPASGPSPHCVVGARGLEPRTVADGATSRGLQLLVGGITSERAALHPPPPFGLFPIPGSWATPFSDRSESEPIQGSARRHRPVPTRQPGRRFLAASQPFQSRRTALLRPMPDFLGDRYRKIIVVGAS